MTLRRYNTILLLAIASQLLAYGFTALYSVGYKQFDGWYYIFNGITHLTLWVCLFFTRYAQPNKWTPILFVYGIILATNQLFDEWIGNPQKIQWNEKLIAAVILVHASYTLIKPHWPKIKGWLKSIGRLWKK